MIIVLLLALACAFASQIGAIIAGPSMSIPKDSCIDPDIEAQVAIWQTEKRAKNRRDAACVVGFIVMILVLRVVLALAEQ